MSKCSFTEGCTKTTAVLPPEGDVIVVLVSTVTGIESLELTA